MCDKLSKYITGFRNSHGTQHTLLVMFEKWKKPLDEKRQFTILEDLLKAFDTTNHDLLLANAKAYGFSENVLKLTCSYLTDRWEALQINNNFSSYKTAHAGALQGSIDGPLLFNVFMDDLKLLLFETYLSNYADDNNFHRIEKEKDITKEKFKKDFKLVTDWAFEIICA